MKKTIFLLTLIVINIIFLFEKVKVVNIEKINLNLNKDELGITFLKLEDSNSILLSLNDINILYLLEYNDDLSLKEELNKFGIKLNYILTNSDYNINFSTKKLINGRIKLNNLVFTKDKIIYKDKTMCINNNDNMCNYIYYTNSNNISINNNNELLLYDENIYNVEDYISNKWIDNYKISKNLYTIIKLNKEIEVQEIMK